MNPFEMVVLIIAIITIGRIITSRMKTREATLEPKAMEDNARLRSEVSQLKERINTLERIAVDKSRRLADEIDSLGPR